MENNEINDIVKDLIPRLHSFVRGRVSNRDDAEDIVQDTIYQFLRTINVLDNPISHVSSWLYTVAHNLIVNHGKKHSAIALSDLSDENDDSCTISLRLWLQMTTTIPRSACSAPWFGTNCTVLLTNSPRSSAMLSS